MLVTVLELSGVLIAISILKDTGSRTFATHIVTFVYITVLKLIDTSPVHLVIKPLPYITVTIGILEDTFSRAKVVFPLTFVSRSVAPVVKALAILLVVQPVSLIESTASEGV